MTGRKDQDRIDLTLDGTPAPTAPRASLAVLLVAGIGLAITPAALPGYVWADSHDDGGHEESDHEGGPKGPGGSGSHDDGHEEDDHADGHEAGGPGGKGGGDETDGHDDGGHEDDGHDDGGHEDRGDGGDRNPAAGGEGDGNGSGQAGQQGGSGKKPVWAQEGIPEVELGRLNVARSPEQVFDRAFNEALASFTPEVAAFYRLDLAAMEKELSENWDNVRLIDSPLQNLALMRDALDGSSVLATVGITTDNDTLLAAFLGTASDKGIPVSAATAAAVSAILGQPLSDSEAAALAEKAEKIRQAILEGHG